jgi:hypothetical protein
MKQDDERIYPTCYVVVGTNYFVQHKLSLCVCVLSFLRIRYIGIGQNNFAMSCN